MLWMNFVKTYDEVCRREKTEGSYGEGGCKGEEEEKR